MKHVFREVSKKYRITDRLISMMSKCTGYYCWSRTALS